MDSPSPSSDKTISSDDEIDYSVKPEFYDPDLDAKDEKWLNKRRAKVGGGGASDAVLSCPACFTSLCLESQRHEQYVTQYRAVFVVNCQVVDAQKSRIHSSEPRSNRKRKNEHGADSPSQEESASALKSVCCGVCSTEVGVFYQDEIYHFFNVLPSEA